MCPAKNLGTETVEEKQNKYRERHIVIKLLKLWTWRLVVRPVLKFTLVFAITDFMLQRKEYPHS